MIITKNKKRGKKLDSKYMNSKKCKGLQENLR